MNKYILKWKWINIRSSYFFLFSKQWIFDHWIWRTGLGWVRWFLWIWSLGIMVHLFFETTNQNSQNKAQNDDELGRSDWKVNLNISVADSAGRQIVFIFKWIIPVIKLLNWTFKLPITEWNFLNFTIVSDLKRMICCIVFPDFKYQVRSVNWVLRNTSIRVGSSVI